ncbi:isochorismatase domain containing protein 2, mitochondrial, putative [Acanthamoeba castellanii str. Neff]|uniref:Isochorismatase domain containing protein 2, mitochondrial, putative n=1 Tax=Acanthamoeba castellanii (strain ATCC 30010 / Neff) TaxID=1257118 RepID=L8GN12_ACACF|nr:isochorismatase domain containing protein 2, mitochondrial, putative [Acanthamoeba castellanii str. Neff]ELR14382.1 isochorismatase domain containing protein 2, mitochondrial, putative [Acanthamoeba castellanii str. Neff]
MQQVRRLGKLQAHSSVLMVCDVQERFRSVITHMPSVLHVARTMVKAAPLLRVPVLVTEQNPKRLGRTASELGVDETEGVRVFEKLKFSMLTDEVRQTLERDHPERKDVLLLGIEVRPSYRAISEGAWLTNLSGAPTTLQAHVCVLQTVLDLLEGGYNVHVLADGTSSSRQADRLLALQRFSQAGAYVTTSESALFQLMQSAEHPSFKAISALVKEERPDSGLSRL